MESENVSTWKIKMTFCSFLLPFPTFLFIYFCLIDLYVFTQQRALDFSQSAPSTLLIVTVRVLHDRKGILGSIDLTQMAWTRAGLVFLPLSPCFGVPSNHISLIDITECLPSIQLILWKRTVNIFQLEIDELWWWQREHFRSLLSVKI